MRIDVRSRSAALVRHLVQSHVWLTVSLVALAFYMPATGPIFHALVPEAPRPVYTRASFVALTLAHIELVAISSLAAATIGIGLGVFVTRKSGREFAPFVGAIAAVGQTFPPVAVLALAIPALGYGAAPTVAALTLYAVLPILEGTITGLHAVPAPVRDAASGLGFSDLDLLRCVDLPLAAPFILAGVHNAVIINIGTATIGSTIGAITLGSPIIEGLSASNLAYVIQGAILVALLAVVTDRWFAVLEAHFVSRAANLG